MKPNSTYNPLQRQAPLTTAERQMQQYARQQEENNLGHSPRCLYEQHVKKAILLLTKHGMSADDVVRHSLAPLVAEALAIHFLRQAIELSVQHRFRPLKASARRMRDIVARYHDALLRHTGTTHEEIVDYKDAFLEDHATLFTQWHHVVLNTLYHRDITLSAPQKALVPPLYMAAHLAAESRAGDIAIVNRLNACSDRKVTISTAICAAVIVETNKALAAMALPYADELLNDNVSMLSCGGAFHNAFDKFMAEEVAFRSEFFRVMQEQKAAEAAEAQRQREEAQQRWWQETCARNRAKAAATRAINKARQQAARQARLAKARQAPEVIPAF